MVTLKRCIPISSSRSERDGLCCFGITSKCPGLTGPIVRAALLSRPFNLDDLEAFSYLPENERPTLYQWLIELPFVRTSPQDGRHSYHDLVQALFSRHLYQRSRKEYHATRRALAEYYRGQLEKTQVEGH